MNQNKFFSFSRFYLLLCNDILLNHKKYLLTIAGAFILGFIVIYSSMPTYAEIGQYRWTFDSQRYNNIFNLCILGLLAFAGSSFAGLSSKVKTSNYLLLPSSTFEKFLSQFVIHVLTGTIIFLFIFWVDAHLARYVALLNLKATNSELLWSEKEKYIEAFNFSMLLIKSNYPAVTYRSWLAACTLVFGLFSVGMYFFTVKIFFKKFGLIKTGISLVALVYFGIIMMMVLSQIFFPGTKLFDVSDQSSYTLSNGYYNIEIWMFIMAFSAPFFIIPFGYFKLKEKQL